ncbi:MAG: RNA polymerase subunit sigma-70, partial [Dysgonamonadaceae bacterium]|nr:RNA polymerase subunit sigma-70 [Dysgonamonadaceae bacterium]
MNLERDYFTSKILPLKRKLFAKAFTILTSAEEAEDAVQDVMLALWNKRTDWQTIDNVEVYAMTLVKNFAIDRFRRKGYRSDSLDDVPDDAHLSAEPNPLEAAVSNDEQTLVENIIARLP